MIDLITYRLSGREKARTADLLRILPKNRMSVLDVGARDGHFSRLLTDHFQEVTALDLTRPAFSLTGVTTVAGDVTDLQFPDNSFDCVFCAEVLEHIPAVEKACQELARVTRHELVIGVPYRQDIRVGRTTCGSCGKHNPRWGHVNTFDEQRLASLFPGMRILAQSFVGSERETTNKVAMHLMDWGGNPWGTYSQDEPCVHCGSPITEPAGSRSILSRICSGLAARIAAIQTMFVKPRPIWIHLVLAKNS